MMVERMVVRSEWDATGAEVMRYDGWEAVPYVVREMMCECLVSAYAGEGEYDVRCAERSLRGEVEEEMQ